MRSVLKVLPLAVLGLAAALLVACGDRNGLLSSGQAGSLQDALAAVQSACAAGDSGRASVAAQSFADRVNALPAGQVDRALVGDLQDGAATLSSLVTRTCTDTTTTTTTPTVTTTTTPTTTATTTTTPTTTTPTTTTAPTVPTTPTTTPPDNGGGTPGAGDTPGPGTGNGPSDNPGGAAPGQVKKALRGWTEEHGDG
jgi:hypothetical protein